MRIKLTHLPNKIYPRYFEWTKVYKKNDRQPSIPCKLCLIAHQRPRPGTYQVDLHRDWSSGCISNFVLDNLYKGAKSGGKDGEKEKEKEGKEKEVEREKEAE